MLARIVHLDAVPQHGLPAPNPLWLVAGAARLEASHHDGHLRLSHGDCAPYLYF